MQDTLGLRADGGALIITLNRPESLNAWNRALGEDLLHAVRHAAANPEVRAVVLTGAGRAFSSGADLRAGFETTADGHPDVRTPLETLYHPIIAAVRRMPKPVLAAVNGVAAGIGCSLALACDLVLARESASFQLAFVNIGLVPDGGSSLLVPERAGAGRAARMAMLGERVPARQALEWGLADRVVADDAFDAEAAALTRRLAEGPTRAYAGIKRQLNAWAYRDMERQLELEAQIQQEMAESGDFREGVQAFLEKRASRFAGR